MNITYMSTSVRVGIISVVCALATACSDGPKPKPPSAATPAPLRPAPAPDKPASNQPANSAAPAPAPAAAPSAPHASGATAGEWKTSGATDDASVIEVGGLTAPKPTTWTWQPLQGQFRVLNYDVPGDATTTAKTELVINLFKGGDGGPLDSNVARWAGQFRTPEGGPVNAVTSEKTVDGIPITLVEIKGSYTGMTAQGGPKPDHQQLTAITTLPGRRVFFKLIGPTVIVERERENWNKLIDGLKQSK